MLTKHLQNKGFAINNKGNLSLRGVDLFEISNLSTRPIYILDEQKIKDNIKSYKEALKQYYPQKSYIYYASKALQNLAICRLMQEQDVGLDLCALGEMVVAKAAKFPFEKTILHGNNKSFEELEYAIKEGLGHIILDNLDEYRMLDELCSSSSSKASILIRVNPHIEVGTHAYIATGVKDAKFGMAFDDNLLEFIKSIQNNPNIKFDGLHCHIGSQISNPNNMVAAMEKLSDYIEMLARHNISCNMLNIGGGVGIKYREDDVMPSIGDFMKIVLTSLKDSLESKNLPLPELMIEPGRSIVGDAGYTLYKVGSIKKSPFDFHYASVNGGMSDNIRTPLYNAAYEAMLVNDPARRKEKLKYKIVGKCCESGDILIQEIDLPCMNFGDCLIIFSTGAYNASMASNFNKHNFPGMIMIYPDGKHDWIVQEQSLDDLFKWDC